MLGEAMQFVMLDDKTKSKLLIDFSFRIRYKRRHPDLVEKTRRPHWRGSSSWDVPHRKKFLTEPDDSGPVPRLRSRPHSEPLYKGKPKIVDTPRASGFGTNR